MARGDVERQPVVEVMGTYVVHGSSRYAEAAQNDERNSGNSIDMARQAGHLLGIPRRPYPVPPTGPAALREIDA